MLLALSKFLPRAFHKKVRKRSSNTDTEVTPQSVTGINANPTESTAKPFTCRVILLDDTELLLDIKVNAKAGVLLRQVFEYLNLAEKQYFGLRYLDADTQPHWLDSARSISSQLQTPVPLTFYFGVKFYAADPCKLFDEITRYQFFLQVKRDIVQGRLPVSYELAAELAAYAVQSELGDYDPRRHSPGYVSEFRFMPNQSEEFESRVSILHCGLKGLVPSRAEYQYLDRVKWLDMYGVDLHLVQGEGGVEYSLGITPTGIIVYKNKNKVANYFWPRLLKLSCKSKQFVIKVRDRNNDENTYTFECVSKQACKHLWKCCTEHHSFFRLTAESQSYQASSKLFSSASSKQHQNSCSDNADGSQQQQQPVLVRKPSRRHQRRISGSESCPEGFAKLPRPASAVIIRDTFPGNNRARDGYSSDAPSAPWNSRQHRGMYTDPESPRSVRSELFPRRVYPGSESESTICSRRHRGFVGASDVESQSDATTVRSHRQNRASADFTESESEACAASRRRHRQRDRSAETLVYDGTQFDELESQRSRESRLAATSSCSVTSDGHRRHRSRSGNRRPPEELAQHFRYVDPAETGLTDEQLREIPYTHVETEQVQLRMKYSPRTRHRMRQRRQKSCGELTMRPRSAWLPDGEAPPPYNDPSALRRHPSQPLTQLSRQRESFLNPDLCPAPAPSQREMPPVFLKAPMPVRVTETQVAPIVKTKVAMAARTDSLPVRDHRQSRTTLSMYFEPVRTLDVSPSRTTEQQSRSTGDNATLRTTPRKPQLDETTCAVKQQQQQQQHIHPVTVMLSTSLDDPQQQQLKHTREDSGLEMDSPESSHTSSATTASQCPPALPSAASFLQTPSAAASRMLSTFTEEESFDARNQQVVRQAAFAHFYRLSPEKVAAFSASSPSHNNASTGQYAAPPVRRAFPASSSSRSNGFLSDYGVLPSRSHKMTEL